MSDPKNDTDRIFQAFDNSQPLTQPVIDFAAEHGYSLEDFEPHQILEFYRAHLEKAEDQIVELFKSLPPHRARLVLNDLKTLKEDTNDFSTNR